MTALVVGAFERVVRGVNDRVGTVEGDGRGETRGTTDGGGPESGGAAGAMDGSKSGSGAGTPGDCTGGISTTMGGAGGGLLGVGAAGVVLTVWGDVPVSSVGVIVVLRWYTQATASPSEMSSVARNNATSSITLRRRRSWVSST